MSNAEAQPRLRGRELVIAGLAILGAMALTLTIAQAWRLVAQPAWLDEYHTLFVANEPTMGAIVRALRLGADYNPPLLHALVHYLGKITGGLDVTGRDVVALRSAFGAITWLALVGVYTLLRARFDAVPAFIGSIAVWSHPLTIQYAFELRFYALWLASVVALLLSLGTGPKATRSAIRPLALAGASIATCMVHYFGVLSCGLVILAAAFSQRDLPFRVRLRWLAPAMAGPLSLASVLPLYFGQRDSLTVPTWLAPPSMETFFIYVFILPGWGLVVAALVYGLGRGAPQQIRAPRVALPHSSAHLGMMSLALVPCVIVAFSLVVQPSVLDRYAIPTVLCAAPLAAAAAQVFAAAVRPTIGIVFMAISLLGAKVALARDTPYRQPSTETVEALHRIPPAGAMVAVCTRHDLYTLATANPAFPQRLVFPVLPNELIPGVRPIQVVERDVARVHARVFGFPHLARLDSLRTLHEFWAVSRNNPPCDSGDWFPNHVADRVGGDVYRMTRH